jgi:glycine dehydrogenase subunit 1
MAVMGKKGIQEVAELCLQKSHYLAGRISQHDGFTLIHTAPFFSEFVVRCSRPAHEFVSAMLKHSILAGVALGQFSNDWRDWLLVAVTEKRTRSEMDRWTEAMVACTE